MRNLIIWQAMLSLWLGLSAPSARAACHDPIGASATAGQFRYMSDYNEFRHCDGTYWQSMATRTSSVSSCAVGTMSVSSGELRMCNGSDWVSMTGTSVGSCSSSGSVSYDSTSKQMRFCMGTSNRQVGLQPSESAAVVSSASPWLQVYDMATGTLRTAPSTLPGSTPWAVAYSPNGNLLALGLASTPHLRVYNVSTMTLVTGIAAPGNTATSLSWKPDGTRLAIGVYSSPYFTVYDTSSWTRLSSTDVPPATDLIRGVSYHPNGRMIAIIGNASPYVTFYDTTTLPYGQPTPIVGTGNTVTGSGGAIAFSPNGRYLAVGLDASPSLMVYDTSSWTRVNLGGLPTAKVRSLAWHPDSSVLVAGSTGGTLLNLYNASNWSRSAPFNVQPTDGTPPVAFNSRGTILGVTMVDNTTNRYITYETYGWTKLTNVSPAPNVDATDTVYGVSFRPGQ